MTTDRKAEGATSGRWYVKEHEWGSLICSTDREQSFAQARLGKDAERLVDLLNRGKSGPTEASLRALRKAYPSWHAMNWRNDAYDRPLDAAIRAILSSSAAEPPIVCTRCGAPYADTGSCSTRFDRDRPCQGGIGEHPRQSEWHAARRARNATEPGKAEAKADEEHPDNALVDRLVAEHRPKATTKRILTRQAERNMRDTTATSNATYDEEPSPPEPQGAQGPTDAEPPRIGELRDAHYVSGHDHAACDVCLLLTRIQYERDIGVRDWEEEHRKVAALETKLAEAEREIGKIDAVLDPGPDYLEEETIDGARRVMRERDEARAKLARISEAWATCSVASLTDIVAMCTKMTEAIDSHGEPEPPNPPAAGEGER